MKKIITSISLILIAIIISHYLASYFGAIYNNLFPTELNSGWIGSTKSLEYIRGISLSLIFFLILFSYPWIFKSKASTLWLISPLLLWEGAMDLQHIYIPIILSLIAFGLATVLQKIFTNKSPVFNQKTI